MKMRPVLPVATDPLLRGDGQASNTRSFYSNFQRHRAFFLVVTILTASAVGGAAVVLSPTYTATSRVRLDPTPRSSVSSASTNYEEHAAQIKVDTELEIMRSRGIVRAVVQMLHLEQDPELSGQPEPGSAASFFQISLHSLHLDELRLEEFLSSWGIGRGRGSASADPVAGSQTSAASVDPTEKVVTEVTKRLKASIEGSTYIASISFQSRSPATAAAVANAVAERYIEHAIEMRRGGAAQQAVRLGQRLTALGAEVTDADYQVAAYRARAGITTTPGQSATFTDQQIATLSGQLAIAESESAAAHSNVQAARAQIAKGGLDSVSGVLSSPVIGELRRQRAEVTRIRAEVLSSFGPEHPKTMKVQNQLEQIDAQLRDESTRIFASLVAAQGADDARATSLRSDLTILRTQQATDARASVAADGLQRQADAKRVIYNQIAQLTQQTLQEERDDQPNAYVVERALLPTDPSFPNKPLFVAIGIFLGLALATAGTMLRELADNGLRTEWDVASELSSVLAGVVPFIRPRLLRQRGRRCLPLDYVTIKPMSGYAESFRNIRGSLLLPRSPPSGSVIAITSAIPREGKTTCAVSLARVMALTGERVLLVDCDLRQSRLGKIFGSAPEGGLLEVLSGKINLDQAIVRDPSGPLSILPLKAALFTPLDLLGGSAMVKLLAELGRRFDHIVLDCPPVIGMADTRAVSVLAGKVVLVLRAGKTPRQGARAAVDLLRRHGATSVSVVLNQTDRQRPGETEPSNMAYYSRAYKHYYVD